MGKYMKQPDLGFNHYFPFYTQKISGKKKYSYWINTVLHLSDSKGILIQICYNKNKIYKVEVEEITKTDTLYDARINHNYISYVDFSKEVNTCYSIIKKALHKTTPEKVFFKSNSFDSIYLKYNEFVQIELTWRKIIIEFGKYNYSIIDGKKVETKESTYNENSEAGEIMKQVGMFLQAINERTTYQEIKNEKFDDYLNRNWEYFIEYFKAPKFINKKQYEPK